METITETILEKKELVDKNVSPYLLLKLDNEKTIFVFPNKVKEERWDQLILDRKYNLTIEENQQGFSLLVDFVESI